MSSPFAPVSCRYPCGPGESWHSTRHPCSRLWKSLLKFKITWVLRGSFPKSLPLKAGAPGDRKDHPASLQVHGPLLMALQVGPRLRSKQGRLSALCWTNTGASEQVPWRKGARQDHCWDPCLHFLWKFLGCSHQNQASLGLRQEARKTNTMVQFYFILCSLHFRNRETRREKRSRSGRSLNLKDRPSQETALLGKINKGKTKADELNASEMLLWNQGCFHCLAWIAHIFVFIADNEFLWHSSIHYSGGEENPTCFIYSMFCF